VTFDAHQPQDFLAPPSELQVAGAPSPVAFRRLVKRGQFASGADGLDAAWRVDREIDEILEARLLHLMWALGVQAQAAREAGLALEARGWLAGLATASALGLVSYDPIALGLSGGDGLASPGEGVHTEVAAPPEQVAEAARWFLEWGRRRRRRFTVALVAPRGRLIPFDWETVLELARPPGRPVQTLSLAWVPDERVVQIPWGETQDGFPVALLPPMHLRSSGVHLVKIVPDELLGAAARRRPKGDPARAELAAAVRAADASAAWDLLASGWIPPAIAEVRPELSGLLALERPATLLELVTLVALASDEVRRAYFLERYQARRPGPGVAADSLSHKATGLSRHELPPSAGAAVAHTRGIVLFVEQVAALISWASGWDISKSFRLAVTITEPDGADLMLEGAWRAAHDRGVPQDELAAVALAVKRWAPVALSMRDSMPAAALIYELAYLRSLGPSS
jgi:hypothetical protein